MIYVFKHFSHFVITEFHVCDIEQREADLKTTDRWFQMRLAAYHLHRETGWSMVGDFLMLGSVRVCHLPFT